MFVANPVVRQNSIIAQTRAQNLKLLYKPTQVPYNITMHYLLSITDAERTQQLCDDYAGQMHFVPVGRIREKYYRRK